MKKAIMIRIILFTVLIFITNNSFAFDYVIFPFNKDLSSFIQHYHKFNNPQKAIDYYFSINMNQFEKNAKINDQPHSRPILMAFYVHIIYDNPDLVIPFTERAIKTLKGAEASFASEIISYGAKEHRDKALKMIFKRYKLPEKYQKLLQERTVMPYPGLDVDHWQRLDIFWACYFASGDIQYLEKIVDTILYWEELNEDFYKKIRELSKGELKYGTERYKKYVRLLSAQSAYKSLETNSRKYPKVKEALKKLIKRKKGVVKKLLNTIIR